MLKKLLAVSLAILMICSSMAVVSLADTNAEPKVELKLVENFNSYTTDNFKAANGNLYFDKDECGKAHHASVRRHFELHDDWIIWDTVENFGTGTFTYYPKITNGYNGKAKDDVSVYTSGRIYKGYRVSNFLNGTPVDLSGGKVFKFSMDWFNESVQWHRNYCNTIPTIYVNATFSKSGSEDITCDNVKLASLFVNQVRDAFDGGVVCNSEAWNALDLYVSKDTIKLQGSEDTALKTFYAKNFNPSTNVWTTGGDSGYEIKSINSLTILFNDNGSISGIEDGYDNLEISVLDSMPQTIVGRHLPFFANFQATVEAFSGTTATSSEVSGANFKLAANNGRPGSMMTYVLSQNYFESSTQKPYRIYAEVLYGDNGASKTQSPNADGYYKVYNIEQDAYTGTDYFEPLSRLRIDANASKRFSNGDKVQVSYEFKFDGNDAKTDKSLIEAKGGTTYNTGVIYTMKNDGKIYDASGKLAAKLNPGTTYSFDIVYTVAESGTEAILYINGSKVLTSVLKDNTDGTVYAYELTYKIKGNTSEDGTKYLANAIYVDNICYQVFKGGANAFNFDKSASTASNKAIANADVDFVNNTIFPVAADFTVADFKELNLTNATVLESDNVTEAADADALAGKVIKFTGDYGKDVYYTVSSEGGANVTKTSFVTIREDLGATLATSANAGKSLTTKAVKDGADLEVYIAEYEDDELVGLSIGSGVANYTPNKSGNKIKVFIWADGSLVPAFTGAASTLNVN